MAGFEEFDYGSSLCLVYIGYGSGLNVKDKSEGV